MTLYRCGCGRVTTTPAVDGETECDRCWADAGYAEPNRERYWLHHERGKLAQRGRTIVLEQTLRAIVRDEAQL